MIKNTVDYKPIHRDLRIGKVFKNSQDKRRIKKLKNADKILQFYESLQIVSNEFQDCFKGQLHSQQRKNRLQCSFQQKIISSYTAADLHQFSPNYTVKKMKEYRQHRSQAYPMNFLKKIQLSKCLNQVYSRIRPSSQLSMQYTSRQKRSIFKQSISPYQQLKL